EHRLAQGIPRPQDLERATQWRILDFRFWILEALNSIQNPKSKIQNPKGRFDALQLYHPTHRASETGQVGPLIKTRYWPTATYHEARGGSHPDFAGGVTERET